MRLPGQIVWYSSPETIRAGRLSLLACLETALAVGLSLFLATWLGIWTQVLASLCIAPLVLLRSDDAVEMAYRWFEHDPWAGEAPPARAHWLIGGIAACLAAGVIFGVGSSFLSDMGGLWAIAWGIGLGLLGLNSAWLVSGFSVFNSFLSSPSLFGGMLGCAAGAVSLGLAGSGWALGFGVFLALPIYFTAALQSRFGFTMLVGPGAALGFLLRAFVCKLAAAIRHLWGGVLSLPANWRRVLFLTDTATGPELVATPGDGPPEHSLAAMVSSNSAGDTTGEKISDVILRTSFALIIIPSFLYRLSIKSTFWVYLPLIYLLRRPHWGWDAVRRGQWVRATARKVLEWVQFLFAVVSLGVAACALADKALLAQLLGQVWAGDQPFSPFAVLFVLDFGALQPWHYLSLPIAALGPVLFFWLDGVARDLDAGVDVPMHGGRMALLIGLYNLRALMSLLWMGMGLWYALDSLHATCEAPYTTWLLDPLMGGPADCPEESG